MAEWSYSAIDQIQTPGGNIACNTGSGDHFFIDPVSSDGLGTSEIRAQIDERGQDHGWLFPGGFLKAGQRISLQCIANILSSATDPGYVTARDAFLTDVRTKLSTILAADGTLHFAGGQTITVRCQMMGAPRSLVAVGPSVKSMLVVLVSTAAA